MSYIRGIFSVEKLNKLKDSYFNKLCSYLIAESLHVKFCKYVLEVSRRSTNIAIAGELGRYPLFLEVILNRIKYFIHLSTPICIGLVAEAFDASRKLHLENKRSWYRNITTLVEHHIDTRDAKPIKQSPPYANEEQNLIDKMQKQGIIQKSTSPWSSPLSLVMKKNGTVRTCVDYRKRNYVTKKDAFPCPEFRIVWRLSQEPFYLVRLI